MAGAASHWGNRRSAIVGIVVACVSTTAIVWQARSADEDKVPLGDAFEIGFHDQRHEAPLPPGGVVAFAAEHGFARRGFTIVSVTPI